MRDSEKGVGIDPALTITKIKSLHTLSVLLKTKDVRKARELQVSNEKNSPKDNQKSVSKV